MACDIFVMQNEDISAKEGKGRNDRKMLERNQTPESKRKDWHVSRGQLMLSTLFMLLYLQASTGAVAADTTDSGYQMVPAKPGEECTVCGIPLTDEDVALIVKGRRVPLNKGMVQEFLENQERYFARLQPRGALFQEDVDAQEGTSLGGISRGWFLFGLYVLVALLFAGMSGYVAVAKGLKPIPHFFIGLFFSVFGFLYVLTRPRLAKEGEIPSGLVKVPLTSAPVPCPKCGYSNHPSASMCKKCGSALSPAVQSEVQRVKGT
jgi:hypothetical protein